ncbi:hypothetical protein WJX72_006515 [[Myrmecia] bisecta]|uniref:Pre-mRNA processing factor 4 (PRP4)-like domain-containing protein n=1 Tax=[Myrmecia] bisecta TaxID=41462 RepID=A0AAW1R7G4_9CHLO
MDSLKALLDKKRKAAQTEFGGRKFVKRSEIEELRLRQLRTEEAQEAQEKELKRKQSAEGLLRSDISQAARAEEVLPREEVIRRLRLLRQPVTLFGEDDADRLARLRKAQEEYELDDEHLHEGQQGNLLLLLEREAKASKRSGKAAPAKDQDRDNDKAASKDRLKRDTEAVKEDAPPSVSKDAALQQEDGAASPSESDGEEGETARAFRLAAQRLKEQREEEQMCVEDRIYKYLRHWTEEWRQDMDRRSDADKASASGHQATLRFEQTMLFFKPLLKQLKRREVVGEMRAGLWLIVQAIKERNYLQAYDIYMRVSIGNSAWPIGVTSVGIHERSAREKISHVMNGAAHIMNDEATRKYLQALKRLLTFMQRAYPTDPSRSVDFDAFHDAGRGAAGSGSDKQALLEAERKGEGWKQLGLLPAPHNVGPDGTINVPKRWDNILSEAERNMRARRGSPAKPGSPARPLPGTASVALSQPTQKAVRPKLLVCHDMAGGYLEDRFALFGGSDPDFFRIDAWAMIDTFVYFSHHLVTIPPPGWMDACHTHGVPVLVELVSNLLHLIRRLRILMMPQQGRVVWYDAVTVQGKLEWQDSLTPLNQAFFDASDALFVNYTWKPAVLSEAAARAGARCCDIYMGIDVFGRGTYGGGGMNCGMALEAVRAAGLSAALFAPGWVYECGDRASWQTRSHRFWAALRWPCVRPLVTALPLVTCFNRGAGRAQYKQGQCVSREPWYNLSAQNLQPLLDDTLDLATPCAYPDLRLSVCEEVVFCGASSLRVTGRGRSMRTLFNVLIALPEAGLHVSFTRACADPHALEVGLCLSLQRGPAPPSTTLRTTCILLLPGSEGTAQDDEVFAPLFSEVRRSPPLQSWQAEGAGRDDTMPVGPWRQYAFDLSDLGMGQQITAVAVFASPVFPTTHAASEGTTYLGEICMCTPAHRRTGYCGGV